MFVPGFEIRHFEEIDSTNTYLMNEARHGAVDGLVAVADHQSAGRGRLDRTWEAPRGASLLASILFRLTLPPERLYLATAAVAVAAHAACWDVAEVKVELKWPNDLLIGNAKLAGILAEVLPDVSGESFAVVVGIGLNLTWPGPPGVNGTSILEASGTHVGRDEFLEAFLIQLGERKALHQDDLGHLEIQREFLERLSTIGQEVSIELATETVIGTAVGLNDRGFLIVESDSGVRELSAGDVIHLRRGSPGEESPSRLNL
jgi:BirA family biotin operon repressor/biotin-[acetyl-CoA-carboxylase] ligase